MFLATKEQVHLTVNDQQSCCLLAFHLLEGLDEVINPKNVRVLVVDLGEPRDARQGNASRAVENPHFLKVIRGEVLQC